MTMYDITRTIRDTTAVWPGDTPYRLHPMLTLESGASVNLTRLTLSPHTGTHADAYFHYTPAQAGGLHPASMPLDSYIGRARVVTTTRRDGALTPDDFPDLVWETAGRLLVRSWVSDLPDDAWPPTFPYLSEVLIARAAEAGIRLIGLDSPSVDAFESTTLPCHHALRQHGIVNLECVFLRGVPDGDYELLALPLKLDGACASPVRAVLRPLSQG